MSWTVKTTWKSSSLASLARINAWPIPPPATRPARPVKIWTVTSKPKSAGTRRRARTTPKAN